MRNDGKANIVRATSVLRDLIMHTQPHTLVRPAVGRSMAVAKARTEAIGDAGLGSKTPAWEQAFADGRIEGYAAGRLAASAEGQHALQASIDEARAAAAEEGRIQGLRDGRALAQVELQQAQAQAADLAQMAVAQRLARLDQLLRSVTSEAAHRLAEAEDDLVALGHEAICRILGSEVATPAVIRAMVKHLLALNGQRHQLAVHVHPDDLAALSQDAGDARTWDWVADNNVQLGGVILRSPEGSLDGRLETQLEALREALLTVRRDRRAAAAREAGAAHSSVAGAPG